MSKQKLRDDHECQNCGHTVEKTYCPNCGQKNTETRQSFWHLFTHFIEDLTHYDGAFWKTIKYLLFRPARLTKEYLDGRRLAYVPPVKLYIFISFITFFLPAILPDTSDTTDSAADKQTSEVKQDSILEYKRPRLDSMEDVYPNFLDLDTAYIIENPMTYTSIRQMDSIENLKPDSLKLDAIDYKMGKKMIHLYKKNTPEQVGEKFAYAYMNNIPKVIFIYMPLFAFWLWLVHGKKRWYFFDHGIFTLHYFAFLLLTVTFMILLIKLTSAIYDPEGYIGMTVFFLMVGIVIWQVYYFYRAHRKMYRESWIVNSFKSTMLFFINIICIIFILVIAGFVTLYNLH